MGLDDLLCNHLQSTLFLASRIEYKKYQPPSTHITSRRIDHTTGTASDGPFMLVNTLVACCETVTGILICIQVMSKEEGLCT